jgi:putative DNA primase/helicase
VTKERARSGKVVPFDAAGQPSVDDAEHIVTEVTQDGVARTFADRYRDALRYCYSAGAWYEWSGTHWLRDDTERAFQFVRAIARELSENRRAKDFKELRRVAFARGVETFAHGDAAFAVTADLWDRDPLLLGTPGGTVDLRTGDLRPAMPSDGITKLTAVAPAENLDCPLWKSFLDDATGHDEQLIRFLQQWAGYSLTGLTREHALLFGYGPGGNGKTVYLNAHIGILADYAVTASMDTFTASIGDRHPTDLAMLRGARLVAASETEQGRTWAESRIKQLTGGDPISARFMRRDFFTFTPNFKLTIIGNHQPMLQTVDDAVRRRFNIVPFLHRPAQPDRHLEDKLRDEWPEILRWMIRGCLDWQRDSLIRPPAVIEATESYFADQDVLAQWLAQECDVQPGNELMKTASADLYRSWCGFATRAGHKAESQKAFAAALQKRGIQSHRSMYMRGFKGIRLRALPIPK